MAIEDVLKIKYKAESLPLKIIGIFSEEVQLVLSQFKIHFKNVIMIKDKSVNFLASLVFGEDIHFLRNFNHILIPQNSQLTSEYFRNLSNFFYTEHKPKEHLFYCIYLLRKLSEILMLFNLHEEALVFLNYLKSLFTGETTCLSFLKFILFSQIVCCKLTELISV